MGRRKKDCRAVIVLRNVAMFLFLIGGTVAALAALSVFSSIYPFLPRTEIVVGLCGSMVVVLSWGMWGYLDCVEKG